MTTSTYSSIRQSAAQLTDTGMERQAVSEGRDIGTNTTTPPPSENATTETEPQSLVKKVATESI